MKSCSVTKIDSILLSFRLDRILFKSICASTFVFSGAFAFGQDIGSRQFPTSVPILNNCPLDNQRRPLTFDPTSKTYETFRTASVNIADLNGDGNLDIVMANGRHSAQDSRIVLGLGNGKFQASYGLDAPNLAAPYDYHLSFSSELVDIDHDGSLDIVVSADSVSSVADENTKNIYINDGKGHFTKRKFGVSSWPTRYATVADVNGDGWADIIMANRSKNNTTSYICYGMPPDTSNGIKGGDINPNYVPFHQGSCTTVTAVDLGSLTSRVPDQHIDLVVPSRDGGQSYIYYNDGNGNFPQSLRKPFGPRQMWARTVEVADFDGDGTLDLAAINQDQGGKSLAIMKGRADGSFADMVKIDVGNKTDAIPYGLIVADIDDDGRQDLVVGYLPDTSGLTTAQQNLARSISACVYFNEGNGVFKRVPLGGSDYGAVYGFAVGDINKDGYLDIATARTGGTSKVYFGAK